MTDSRAQATYQVRLGWGTEALTELAESPIVIVVDALEALNAVSAVNVASAIDLAVDQDTAVDHDALAVAPPASHAIAERAAALPHRPTVFLGSLRNATATAQAAYDEQVSRRDRTAINLVLVGNETGGFAVEDYLAAGAIADALTALGIDHSAPEVAVAAEGFRPLTRALKHLLSASVSGHELKEAGLTSHAKEAAELDADPAATRFAN